MRRSAAILLLALFLLSACAPHRRAKRTPETPPPPLAPEVEAQLRKTERLGRQIYEQDAFAWQATDLLLEKINLTSVPDLSGWLVHDQPGTPTVTFYEEKDGQISVLADINYTNGHNPVVILEPDRRATAEEEAMLHARNLAIKEGYPSCSKSVNTVVLPSERPDAWDIYVLTPQSEPDIIPVGRHARVTVSKTTHKVLDKFFFSNTCLLLNKRPPDVPKDATPDTLVFSHLVSNLPEAVHVFSNLAYKISLAVVIVETHDIWMIEDGHIRYMGKTESKQ